MYSTNDIMHMENIIQICRTTSTHELSMPYQRRSLPSASHEKNHIFYVAPLLLSSFRVNHGAPRTGEVT